LNELLMAVRGVHFAATLWAAGTICFIVLVAAPLPLLRRLTLMVWAALVLSVLTGLAWFVLVAGNILDAPLSEIGRDGLWTVLSETRYGQIAALRLGFAVALGGLMAAPSFTGERALQLAAAGTLAGLIALVGHAGATPGPAGWLHLTSDVVHILAASAWLGGLPALAMALGAAGAVATTARFSLLGMVSVGGLLASGVINSWQLLNGPGDLTATVYGRVLAVKIALFTAMVAIAAFNRTRLTPRLPAARAIAALRRNSLIETALGLAVLLLAGALGTMIPGGHVHTNAPVTGAEAAYVHIHTEAAMADVTIDPGRAGTSSVTIRVSREDFSNYPASDVKLAIAPRDGGAPLLERAAVRGADGTWLIDTIDIPRPGVWLLRITIEGGGAPLVLDAPIVITQCSNECS
jgi:putative copper resistance protein D